MSTHRDKLEATAAGYHASDAVPDIHIENIYQKHFNDWLLTRIPHGSSVLEMGFGDGIVTEALVAENVSLTVLEGAATLANLAKARFPQVRTVNALFEDFAEPNTYDVILASHVLEHVNDPVAILRRMSTWVKPTGKIIVAVPNRNSLHRQLAVMMGLQPALDSLSPRDLLVGHQRVYSLEGLEADLQAAGFETIETAGFFLKVVPNSMMLDYPHTLVHALNAISPRVPTELLANLAVIGVKTKSS